MVFETLYESKKRGELLLIDGGMCHWHLRKDGQVTIREIFSTRPGAGREMIDWLKRHSRGWCLFAKCPVDLTANEFYYHLGFALEGQDTTKTGRKLNLWRLQL